jgi:hypothetical protein
VVDQLVVQHILVILVAAEVAVVVEDHQIVVLE